VLRLTRRCLILNCPFVYKRQLADTSLNNYIYLLIFRILRTQNHNLVSFWSVSADKVKIYILCDEVFEKRNTSNILLRYNVRLCKIGLTRLVDFESRLTKGIILMSSEWTL
jgi:hypothetical protein